MDDSIAGRNNFACVWQSQVSAKRPASSEGHIPKLLPKAEASTWQRLQTSLERRGMAPNKLASLHAPAGVMLHLLVSCEDIIYGVGQRLAEACSLRIPSSP